MRDRIVANRKPPADPRTIYRHSGIWFMQTLIDQYGGQR